MLFIWIGDSWWQMFTAVVFAFLFTQTAFLGHDAAHRQIFRSGKWNDWVSLGYFADSEAATNGIANDIRATFSTKKGVPPNGSPQSILNSPVFAGVRSVRDFQALIVVTASKTSNFTVERVFGLPCVVIDDPQSHTPLVVPRTRS